MEARTPTPTLCIRRARRSEAATISFLLRVAFAEIAALYTPEALAATLPDAEVLRQRMEEGAVWIAFLGDAPVGTLSAYCRPEGLHLRSMGVHPGARGHGVGRALLAVAERFGRDRGLARVFLRTTPFLNAAIALYSRVGFSLRQGGDRDFHGVPLFEMEKPLSASGEPGNGWPPPAAPSEQGVESSSAASGTASCGTAADRAALGPRLGPRSR
jgi:GNAT superfamily N-acetyltransferase